MRFRCNLCSSPPRFFEWEDKTGVCPQCGASGVPHVASLIDVHLIVLDRKGPIQGPAGRQLVACQPQRAYLARHPQDMFAASDDPRAVTCPRCRRLPVWKDQAKLYEELEQALDEIENPPTLTADLGAVARETTVREAPLVKRDEKLRVEKGGG